MLIKLLKNVPISLFAELTAWYLNLQSVKRLKSFVRLEGALKNFNAVFGQHLVNKIKPEHLENYQISREEQGRAPATIDMEVKISQTVITKAFDNELIDAGPLRSFRKIKRRLRKGDNARKRKLTIEEYSRLLINAPGHLRAILIVAMNTGMRLGEIRCLKWSRVDKEASFVRLRSEDTKEARKKNIPINHHVEAVLNNQIRHIDHDYVFTYRGKPIKERGGLRKSFATACKKAGVPCGRKTENGITFHDIRSTVKTNMVVSGVNKIHCDVILGHALQGMDTFYIVLEDKELKNAIGIYTKWLDEELKNVDQTVDQDQKRGQAF